MIPARAIYYFLGGKLIIIKPLEKLQARTAWIRGNFTKLYKTTDLPYNWNKSCKKKHKKRDVTI